MDKIDQKILNELNRNCRIKKSELAKIVHLTPPAVNIRIEQLEAEGVIKKYTIEVALQKLGYSQQVMIQAKPPYYHRKAYLALIQSNRQSIRHHYEISGELNYMIEGAFCSNEALHQFLAALQDVADYQEIHVISELF